MYTVQIILSVCYGLLTVTKKVTYQIIRGVLEVMGGAKREFRSLLRFSKKRRERGGKLKKNGKREWRTFYLKVRNHHTLAVN